MAIKKGALIMSLPTRVQRSINDYFDPQREVESLLSRFLGARGEPFSNEYGVYPVDVSEDADHMYVEAELPGFRKEDIDVTFDNQTLTISAERSEDRQNGDGKKADPKKPGHLLHERRYTRFLRSFTLPPTVSAQKVDAKLQDGVLTITLDKREETKPRKIQVS
jgi:HSP20 family protein